MRIETRVIRGDRVESVHTGEAVVLDNNRQTVFASERPEYAFYARSSLKPFQVYPLVASGAARGYGLSVKELAVCCASHNGETMHVGTVSDLQGRTGIREEMLRCGVHAPMDKDAAEALFRSDLELSQNYNNCSGKHTGMLLLAKHLGVSFEGYIEADHPVQQRIFNYISSLVGRKDIHLGIDGCSVPTYYLTLRELAGLFLELISSNDPSLQQIREAMMREPYLVAGRERFDTDIMKACRGRVVSKTGAEGVRGIGIRSDGESYGLALKVADGGKRASATMALGILGYLGLWNPDENPVLDKYQRPILRNHRGIEVGFLETEIIES